MESMYRQRLIKSETAPAVRFHARPPLPPAARRRRLRCCHSDRSSFSDCILTDRRASIESFIESQLRKETHGFEISIEHELSSISSETPTRSTLHDHDEYSFARKYTFT
eukprot:496258-Pleurochrysis_carterae.AAC.1